MHEVAGALARPQRDALELQRGLGDLLPGAPRGARRQCARSETCLPIRAVKRSSTCWRIASVTAVLCPLISILTVDLPRSAAPNRAYPTMLALAPRCRAIAHVRAKQTATTSPRPRRAAPARRRRAWRRSCRRRPRGSRAPPGGTPGPHADRAAARWPGARRAPRPTWGAHGRRGAARRRPASPVSPRQRVRDLARMVEAAPAVAAPAGRARARARPRRADRPGARACDRRRHEPGGLRRASEPSAPSRPAARRPRRRTAPTPRVERRASGARHWPGPERHERRRRSRRTARRRPSSGSRHATHSGGTTSDTSRSDERGAIADTIPCRRERLTRTAGTIPSHDRAGTAPCRRLHVVAERPRARRRVARGRRVRVAAARPAPHAGAAQRRHARARRAARAGVRGRPAGAS